MTATNAHRADLHPVHPYLREGYAAGSTENETWLAVHGSAYDSRLVFAAKDEAEQRANVLRAVRTQHYRDAIVVRYVRRVFHGGVSITNEAYRIIPE